MSPHEPIAIVGMACRLPGNANSPSGLWELLTNERSAQGKVPEDRFNASAFYHPNGKRPGSISADGGYFLKEEIHAYDAAFFGTRPAEAASLDPQQKKLLEVCYECLETSGLSLKDISGSNTGCYIGSLNLDLRDYLDQEYSPDYAWTGCSATILSNRLSYFFDLRGPSVTLDTACSSSLYSLHVACSALRNGEIDGALVGASNLIFSANQMMSMSNGGVLSPTSTCHSFDIRANGYGRGEGIGMLYLTTLSEAQRRNLPIRALIRGSALNSNGRTAGITHPDEYQQEAVIRAAYAAAGGLDPRDTGYFECHGTGTKFGDVIETRAISRAFSSIKEPLIIGAVKSNIGHSEPTSAISGIIKAVLALESGIIPPTFGFKTPNPEIHFDSWKLSVATKNTLWPQKPVRRASVNSFGYGGANGHVVLESVDSFIPGITPTHTLKRAESSITNNTVDEVSFSCKKNLDAHHRNLPQGTPRKYLLPFSAHTQFSLEKGVQVILDGAKHYRAKDLAYTLGRRTQFGYRAYALAEGKCTAVVGSVQTGSYQSKPPGLAFVFTGQGAYWNGVGRGLTEAFPKFRESVREVDKILQSIPSAPNWKLETLLESNPPCCANGPSKMQLVTTAIQVSIVDLLDSWNIKPDAVIGHSSGEIAAAYAAGLIGLEQAIVAAYYRGLSVEQHAQPGKMMAVAVSKEKASELLECVSSQKLTIACENSSQSITLSGPAAEIDLTKVHCKEKGILAKVLDTGGQAYHSDHMDRAASAYMKSMEEISPSTVETPNSSRLCTMISTVSGSIIQKHEMTPQYWVKNLQSPVKFSDGLSALLNLPLELNILIEIGPHSSLEAPIRDLLTQIPSPRPAYQSSLIRQRLGEVELLNMAGRLFLEGCELDFAAINASAASKDQEERLIVDLPTYCWDHRVTYSAYSRESENWNFRKHQRHDLLGSQIPGSGIYPRIWRNIIRLSEIPWLRDHKIGGQIVFPFTGYLLMAVEAARQSSEDIVASRDFGYELSDVSVKSPLALYEEAPSEVYLELQPSMRSTTLIAKASYSFKIRSPSSHSVVWSELVSGNITVIEEEEDSKYFPPDDLLESQTVESQEVYGWFEKLGYEYGSSFKNAGTYSISLATRTATTTTSRNPSVGSIVNESSYLVHPITLDQAIQTGLLSLQIGSGLKRAHLPISVETLYLAGVVPKDMSDRVSITSRATRDGVRSLALDSQIRDSHGNILLRMKTLRATEADLLNSNHGGEVPRYPFCYPEWSPDISTVTHKEATVLFPSKEVEVHIPAVVADLELMALHCIIDGLNTIENLGIEKSTGQEKFQKYFVWMSQEVQKAKQSSTMARALELETCRRLSVIDELKRRLDVPEAELVWQLWKNFPKIISGEKTSMEVLASHNAWDDMFRSGLVCSAAYEQARRVTRLLSHRNPQLRILEVGAGTGGLTLELLDELQGDTEFRLYDEYMFTDISPGFFSAAQAKLGKFRGVKYVTLDLERCPEEQGFTLHSYDVVVASNVIHATSNLQTTMSTIRRLLKPGGYFLMGELTKEYRCIGFVMGSLPGWWLSSEAYRASGPLMTNAQWKMELSKAGFCDGFTVNDFRGAYTSTCIFLARSPEEDDIQKLRQDDDSVTLITLPAAGSQRIAAALRGCTNAQKIISIEEDVLDHRNETPRGIALFLDCGPETVLRSMESVEMDRIRGMFKNFRTLFWITTTGVVSGARPDASMVAGFCRTLREEEVTNIYTIDLDPVSHDDYDTNTANLLAKHLELYENNAYIDYDFAIRDGITHICRFYPATDLNVEFNSRVSGKKTLQKVNREAALRMDLEQIGLFSSLYFREDESVFEDLHSEFIEIRVHAYGMNFKDFATCIGRINAVNYSNEGAGIVSRIGDRVTRFKVGDRVAGFGGVSNYGDLMRAHQCCFISMKADESFESMASLPVVFGSALYCLKYMAHLEHGESILIHAAAGGLGLAAIQTARLCGAEIYATVGSPEKKRYLIEHCGIPADHIFNSRDTSFSRDVKRATNGRGVDVVLTSAAGNILQASLSCLGPLGRLISTGVADVREYANVDVKALGGSKSLMHFNLKDIEENFPLRIQRLLEEAMNSIRGRILKPSPIRLFPHSDLEGAFREFMKGEHIGKLVVSLDSPAEQFVQVVPSEHQHRFRSDASYLLIGCLGGLGREIASWMTSRGARHLVFLSRSGTGQNKEALTLVKNLRSKGIKVDIALGDVCNLGDLHRCVQGANPPIRGVIHAAMVLQNVFFNKMTAAQWHKVLSPKVTGAMNLHSAFENRELDFLLFTSSIAGVYGVIGQSNYSAANAFLDSFAKWRTAQGLPTVALDVGVVQGVGYVHERPELHHYLSTQGGYGIPVKEIIQLIDMALQRCSQLYGSENSEAMPTSIITGYEAAVFKKLEDAGVFNVRMASKRQPQTSTIARFLANAHEQVITELGDEASQKARNTKEEIGHLLKSDESKALKYLTEAFVKKLSQMLSIDRRIVDMSKGVAEYGMDSMIAGELRGWFLGELGIETPLLEILSPSHSISSLSAYALSKIVRR